MVKFEDIGSILFLLTDQCLDFKTAQRNHVSMVDGLVLVWGNLIVVDPGAIGRPKVFYV